MLKKTLKSINQSIPSDLPIAGQSYLRFQVQITLLRGQRAELPSSRSEDRFTLYQTIYREKLFEKTVENEENAIGLFDLLFNKNKNKKIFK